MVLVKTQAPFIHFFCFPDFLSWKLAWSFKTNLKFYGRNFILTVIMRYKIIINSKEEYFDYNFPDARQISILKILFAGVWAHGFSFSPREFFPFSNLTHFPFKPKETQMREENFYEMKEREKVLQYFLFGKGHIM